MEKLTVLSHKRKEKSAFNALFSSNRHWFATFGLWLFTIGFSFAQQSNIDSLLNILKNVKEDTTKVNTLNALFYEYEFKDDEKSKEYLNTALELSQKIDFKRGLATTYKYLGYFEEDKGNYPEALKNYQASLKIAAALSDKKGIADAYNNIGITYKEQGNFSEALKNYFIALKIREAIGFKKGIAASYNSIGNVYYAQGNYPEALKNYFASLKIREAIDDKQEIGTSYNNIGNVYSDQGNYPEALKNHVACLKIMKATGNKKGEGTSYNNIAVVYYDQGKYQEALKNHLASLKIREALGDKKGIASSYNNIGNVYSAQAARESSPELRKNKFDQALKNLFTSLKIKNAIGDKMGIAGSFGNIGDIYAKEKKYKEAQEYLTKSEELSKEIGFKKNLKETYSNLTYLDSAKGDFKSAYENHKLYILYSDSLDNEETRKKTIQSQMTFDFDKKEAVADAENKKELENQQVLAEEKSRKQKIVIVFVVVGLFSVLVFAGFVFRSLRLTRKQKTVIEEQKLLVEEKQKEVLDSIYYARRIQRSLLPTEKYIDRSLKRLNKNFKR